MSIYWNTHGKGATREHRASANGRGWRIAKQADGTWEVSVLRDGASIYGIHESDWQPMEAFTRLTDAKRWVEVAA